MIFLFLSRFFKWNFGDRPLKNIFHPIILFRFWALINV